MPSSVLTTAGESAVNFVLDLKDEGISPNDLRIAGSWIKSICTVGKADCLRQFAVEEREHPNENCMPRLHSLVDRGNSRIAILSIGFLER